MMFGNEPPSCIRLYGRLVGGSGVCQVEDEFSLRSGMEKLYMCFVCVDDINMTDLFYYCIVYFTGLK